MSNVPVPTSNISDIRPAGYPPGSHGANICIVGHNDFSTDSLASMLGSQNAGYLVTCVTPDDSFLTRLATTEPDVLLIQNGALKTPIEQFIQDLQDTYPDIRLLVFGKNLDDDYLYRLVRCGVHGYINERMNGDHIKRALESVISGHTWIERHIMERFISTQHDFDSIMESQFYARIDLMCTNLSRREIEILCEVVKGLAIKQIAARVHLSHQGVKMHLAKLFRKFNVANRNQLILATFDAISPVGDLSALLRSGLNRRLDISD